ncbi:hypothetical protein QBC42DRAFT_230261 [Cladorrhinum samala]|uniref:Uncharacterized protein n=1 Tax=Cladorrhinum samala TaxID=585594 RepID=A0AAV9HM58_9PEZI|nr:hypothetical protein QBC42DRAFT_230261 [Cladorrhinum samala]
MQFTIATVLALATAITGASASFKKACTAPYDVCGWTLADGVHGYDYPTLQEAVRLGGGDPNNGRDVYDAIYGCRENGAIVWKLQCDLGCNSSIDVPNANCRA